MTRAISLHYSKAFAAAAQEPAAAAADNSVAQMVAELAGDSALNVVTTPSRHHQEGDDREAAAELQSNDTPAVRLVSAIISAAIGRGASDIHFEQEAHTTEVRVRVDGVLHKLTEVPAKLRHSIVSRIKILADMDISEKRVPQDGSFLVRRGDSAYDLRISTLPTQNGEKVVIRVLNAGGPSAELRDLGMPGPVATSLTELLTQPQGLILVTGPTGSGKTTTLYASLKMLRERKLNITTVEDPIEYVLEGITQVEVNTKAGRTFAGCLRSILRQDPNVILIGEIRDQETAEIAVQASQTGHLVLATLHTNDSFGAIGRLLDLDISRFLLSTSVSAVMGQRLVRKLCPCRVKAPLSSEYRRLAAMAAINTGPAQAEPEWIWSASGCAECGGTGYKGRIGIYELLRFTHAIRDAVTSEGGNDELRSVAAAEGMKTMFQQAMAFVDAGITTVEELLRVIPMGHELRNGCPGCQRAIAGSFKFCPHCGKPRSAKLSAKEAPAEVVLQ